MLFAERPVEKALGCNRHLVPAKSFGLVERVIGFPDRRAKVALLQRSDPDADGYIEHLAFGTYRLPPDWLSIGSQAPRIADGWPPYFGFDAVRIPLYIAWRNEQARLGRFLSAWQTPQFGGKPPA